MSLINRFLTEQREEALRWSSFLTSLHPGRTATLAEVLESDGALTRLGLADVIDRELLRKRIVAYCDYVNRVPGGAKTLRRGPLVFFQSTLGREEKRDKSEESPYANLREEARYFHTETNFTPETIGDWASGTRLIRPGYAFSNHGWRGLYQSKPDIVPRSASVIGYRLPRFTGLLGISQAVATEYVARIITHDLGHAHLPDVEDDCEPLHDVAMIHAMGALGTYSRDFQGVVHRECTDPFFFLDPSILWEISTDGLTHTQRFLLEKLRQKYGAESLSTWATLFQITDDVTEEGARAHVTKVLFDLRAGHYKRYGKAA